MVPLVADGRFESVMASSSRLRAVRASPSAKAAIYSRKPVSTRDKSGLYVAPSISRARSRIVKISSLFSCCRVKVRHRESNASCTLKLGFSVVAPMRVICPLSTGPRNTSCCVFEKRWISSQKMIVFRPVRDSSDFASANSFLHSATPEEVLLISTKRLPDEDAITRAIVVLPVPALPHRIMDGTRSASMRPRRTPVGPTRSCP